MTEEIATALRDADEIRLTRKEWNIVEVQCKYCKHWSMVYGCQFSGAGDEYPVSDCLVPREDKDEVLS